MDVLKDLEEKVGAACEQLEALRKQNRGLRTRVKKLEAELAEGAGDGAWSRQRDEVRERVSRLAEGLEALV